MSRNIGGFDDAAVLDKAKYMKFTIKNIYSTKNNPICGITIFPWLKILWKYGRYIEIQYIPRVAFVSAVACFNTVLSTIEQLLYAYNIRRVQLPDDPVFIIGHPRTGTTLMHNLLGSDSDNFYYCNTFCAGFPSSFLWFEKWGKIAFSSIMEEKRPMDSMPLHFDLPQEDEIATNVLSGGISYYMPLFFMKQEPLFRRFLDFSPDDGATASDEAEWCSSFLYLLRKLYVRERFASSSENICRKKLLLKSPVHTARVPLLRRLFPRAKFIYIHR
jgi:hypothetical protein